MIIKNNSDLVKALETIAHKPFKNTINAGGKELQDIFKQKIYSKQPKEYVRSGQLYESISVFNLKPDNASTMYKGAIGFDTSKMQANPDLYQHWSPVTQNSFVEQLPTAIDEEKIGSYFGKKQNHLYPGFNYSKAVLDLIINRHTQEMEIEKSRLSKSGVTII